jgi:hypothetical protein
MGSAVDECRVDPGKLEVQACDSAVITLSFSVREQNFDLISIYEGGVTNK